MKSIIMIKLLTLCLIGIAMSAATGTPPGEADRQIDNHRSKLPVLANSHPNLNQDTILISTATDAQRVFGCEAICDSHYFVQVLTYHDIVAI